MPSAVPNTALFVHRMANDQGNRSCLLRGHVNWICEYPEGPAPPAGQAGLAQENLGAIAAGAGDGSVDGPSLLLRDLPPVAEKLYQRETRAGGHGNLDASGSRPAKKVTGPAGTTAARDTK